MASTWGGTQKNNSYLPKRTQDWFNPLQHIRHTADMLGAEPDQVQGYTPPAESFQRGQGDPSQSATAAALGYQGTAAAYANDGANEARWSRIQGQSGLTQAQLQARQQNEAGQAFQNSQTAAALGYQGQGRQVAGRQGSAGIAQQAAQGADTTALRNFYQQGPGPSAAQAQLRAGQDASLGQALAMARSGRNGTNAAAERQAMFQNAATNQQTNQAAASLRANEEAAWRGQQLGAMTAEQQAIAQGRSAQLQALGYGLQERTQNDQTALGYGQLANQTNSLGLQGGLGYGQLAGQTQGLGQQYALGMGGLANQQDQLGGQLGLGYTQLGESTMQSDADREAMRQKVIADQQLAASQANTQAGNAAAAGNRQMLGSILSVFSDERLKTNIEPTDTDSGGSGTFAKFAQFFGNDSKREQSHDDSGYQSMGNGIGSLIGGGGKSGGGGMLSSDEHSKRRIAELESELSRTYAALGGKPATQGVRRDNLDLDALDRANGRTYVDSEPYKLGYRASYGHEPGVDLRPARGYSYEYKDPSAPGAAPGRHYGPMAQDLERTPAGASTVVDTPQGKQVDTPRLTMVNTAAISEQQRRTQELEQELDELRAQKGREFVALGGKETTSLSPDEERSFQDWARRNNVRDVDHPDSHYDYRGYWRENPNANIRGGVDHFPDTYKQHGHPTFSTESRYSRGPGDGGNWLEDVYFPGVPHAYDAPATDGARRGAVNLGELDRVTSDERKKKNFEELDSVGSDEFDRRDAVAEMRARLAPENPTRAHMPAPRRSDADGRTPHQLEDMYEHARTYGTPQRDTSPTRSMARAAGEGFLNAVAAPGQMTARALGKIVPKSVQDDMRAERLFENLSDDGVAEYRAQRTAEREQHPRATEIGETAGELAADAATAGVAGGVLSPAARAAARKEMSLMSRYARGQMSARERRAMQRGMVNLGGAPELTAEERHIRDTYAQMRKESGMRNQSIPELVRRTGLPKEKVHEYLMREAKAHRANPTRGEPTAVSDDDLRLAMPNEETSTHDSNTPYLTVELHGSEFERPAAAAAGGSSVPTWDELANAKAAKRAAITREREAMAEAGRSGGGNASTSPTSWAEEPAPRRSRAEEIAEYNEWRKSQGLAPVEQKGKPAAPSWSRDEAPAPAPTPTAGMSASERRIAAAQAKAAEEEAKKKAKAAARKAKR